MGDLSASTLLLRLKAKLKFISFVFFARRNIVILSYQQDKGMNKELLKSIIADNQAEIPRHEVVPRDFSFEDFGNYVFVGILRAGKSYLLYQRIQQLLANGTGWDEILYINFEDERLGEMGREDLNLLLETHMEMYGKRPILFLDEIQNIEGWEKFARRLADAKYKVYITGSNAKMLSSEIQTTLEGRYINVNVYPYSFMEYLTANHVRLTSISLYATESRAEVLRYFEDYFHSSHRSTPPPTGTAW